MRVRLSTVVLCGLVAQTVLFVLVGVYLTENHAAGAGGGDTPALRTEQDVLLLPPRAESAQMGADPLGDAEDVDDDEDESRDGARAVAYETGQSLPDVSGLTGGQGGRRAGVGRTRPPRPQPLAIERSMFGANDDADATLEILDEAAESQTLSQSQAEAQGQAGSAGDKGRPVAGARAGQAACVGWMCGSRTAPGGLDPEELGRYDPRAFVAPSTPGVVRAPAPSRGTPDVLTLVLANCSRKFKVGDRKDHKRSIASAFRELGLCETRYNDYDVRWGQQWDWGWEPDRKEIMARKNGDIVNNIPGFQDTVGEKLGLARMHMDCIDRYGPHQAQMWCSYTKRAFNVGRFGAEVHFRYTEFRKHSKTVATQQNVKYPLFWIIKKQQKSYGSHFMQIVALRRRDLTSTGDLARWIDLSIPEGGWTIQEYIKYPLTYRGRKFDVRVWGLVTSVNPLRVYLLDAAFPKVSTFAYNDSVANLANPCMHVIMPLGEACAAFADQMVNPYPPSTRSRLFLEHIKGYRSKITVDWREMWAEEVWPQIAIKIIMALVQSRARPLKIDRAIKAAGRRYKRFLFLSPDFVIDANGGAFMVELNTNGFMIGDQYPELFTAQNETKAAMVMLGVTGYPWRPGYEADMRAAIGDFCSTIAPCDPGDQAALQELVDEERHLSHGWTRIFPSELFTRYWQSLDHSQDLKGDGQMMTAQDKLTESFIRTTWQPRFGGHQYVASGTVGGSG